ncbi:MAG: AraC family transcriptional regulator [Burkholderiales bacterium]|nr:MAG: AraC family transcriptional regulator [Burkholderiales bacterium]
MSSERLFVRLADDPLYAPETTVPAGTMREFTVPGELTRQVVAVMAYEEQLPAAAQVTERVLPDGAARLIVDTSGGMPSVRLVGATSKAQVLTHRGRVQGLSLTLRAGASLTLFGIPAHELAGRAFVWDEVAPQHLRTLPERMHALGSTQARVRLLLGLFGKEATTRTLVDPERTIGAMQILSGTRSRQPVRDAAALLGVGERRLEQLFRDHVGLSPKTWHRLARFHECLRLLRRQPSVGWVDLAMEAGFHDQAHLIKDFRGLAGLSPSRLAGPGAASGFSKTGPGHER